MSKVCEISGKKPMSGNNVSHANNRTKRRKMKRGRPGNISKQQREILEIIKYSGIGIICVIFVVLVIYIMSIMNANGARALEIWGKEQEIKVDPCVDYMTDVFVCINQGPDEAAKHWRWVACPLTKQQPLNLGAVIEQSNGRNAEDEPFLKASKICQYKNNVVLLARECPKLISCK